ncbi:hypothetical protein BDV96DRAFT_599825 [Lophiotrema nucula]|uniref:Uncharacterized protein n=1 Tax=Lophiotrema nucula TaxID=690887 RepID=A0A6A5Z882_9PLEO|nr:hypothetical protein BDV96DRAFT_599825 [Lophiotrema nucula]
MSSRAGLKRSTACFDGYGRATVNSKKPRNNTNTRTSGCHQLKPFDLPHRSSENWLQDLESCFSDETTHTTTQDNTFVDELPLTPAISPYWNLPRELRDKIYDYAWTGTTVAFQQHESTIFASYGDEAPRRATPFPKWTFICKQIQYESMEALHKGAIFILGYGTRHTPSSVLHQTALARYLRPKLQLARKWQLVNVRAETGRKPQDGDLHPRFRLPSQHEGLLKQLSQQDCRVQDVKIQFIKGHIEWLLNPSITGRLVYPYLICFDRADFGFVSILLGQLKRVCIEATVDCTDEELNRLDVLLREFSGVAQRLGENSKDSSHQNSILTNITDIQGEGVRNWKVEVMSSSSMRQCQHMEMYP